MSGWKPKIDNTNWYLKLEKCYICRKGFTQEDVDKWEERIITVQTGPTRWGHSACHPNTPRTNVITARANLGGCGGKVEE